MELTIERTGPCQARVSFTIPAGDFESRRRQQLAEVAGRVSLKGFRPGKVPQQILERQFGQEVRERTKEHFLREALQRAVEQEKLRPAAWPRVELASLAVAEDGTFAHTFELALRPEFELSELKGLEVEAQPIEVAEAEIDAALADLRRQQSRPEPAGEAGLPRDGVALARVEIRSGEEVVLARDGMRLSPTTPPPGIEPEAFERILVGAREGETREVPMTFPSDWEREDLRGRSGSCRVVLSQVMRVVPPTDEDLQRLVGAEAPEGLRTKAAEHIRAFKEEREAQRVSGLLFERALELNPMELPASLVEQQAEARLEALRREFQGRGVSLEEVEAELGREREAAREGARRALRAAFLVEAVAAREKLELGERDFARELEQIAQRNQASPAEVRDFYQKNTGLRDQLGLELLERKVRAFLREHARIRPA